MSKKFKSQASSSRAATGAFGSGAFGAFSQTSADKGAVPSSLSYIFEPPDLSLISQPHVVVAFKNLSKKDSITKSKALEDLLDFICGSETQGVRPEEGFLEAWAKLYPRISIDALRRVRQLAHTLQGYIVSTTGKPIARFLPRVIGAWLAGLYDNDKLAVKAAQDSILRAFPTEEKRQAIWNIYQSAILEFVVDAVVQQTPLTLSDERTVSPDEAKAKHARVVATALRILDRLLAKTSSENLEKDSSLLQTVFESRALWQFSHHEDPFVRRSLYELCQTSISVASSYIEWKTISAQLLSKSLAIDQYGSAAAFSNVLLALTRSNPQVWTISYSGKTAASKRLLQYIKKGSQGAPPLFWQNLQDLVQIIPIEVIIAGSQDMKTKLESASSVMEAFLDGISHREEPRSNLFAAWSSYIRTSLWVFGRIEDPDCRLSFMQSCIFPLVEHYVFSPPDQSKWIIQDDAAAGLCAECVVSAAKSTDHDVICKLWAGLSASLSENIKLSAPEQSQNYQTSQNSICLQSSRLFGLESQVVDKLNGLDDLSFVSKVLHDTTLDLFQTALQILKSRKGKPYGAAAVIQEAIAKVPQFITDTDTLRSLLTEDIPSLVSSPSSYQLVSVLFACRNHEQFQFALKNLVDALQTSTLDAGTLPGLRVLFSSATVEDLNFHPQLETLTMGRLDPALNGDKEAWDDIVVILDNDAFSAGIANRILNRLVESLSVDIVVIEVLRSLTKIVNMDSTKAFVTGPGGSKLISKLLFLSESDNEEVAQLADSVQSTITSLTGGKAASKPTVDIIQSSFNDVGKESLSVDTLATIAEELLQITHEEGGLSISSLFPSEQQWSAALQPFLQTPPPPSLSIMSPLGGAVFLVERPNEEGDSSSVPRDSNQLTLAARLALYVTKILDSTKLDDMEPELQTTLFLYLPLVVQLIDDDLNVEGSTGVLPLHTPETRDIFASLVSEARHIINQWVLALDVSMPLSDSQASTNVVAFWQSKLEELQGNTPSVYRFADMYTRILSERDALGKTTFAESSLELSQRLHSSSNPFIMIAVVTAFKTSLTASPTVANLCNRLVAQATGLVELPEIEGLHKLTTLNALTQGDGKFVANIPTQRLVFLVKHLITCLQSGRLSLKLETEVLKTLTTVLPHIKEIYGSHWTDIFVLLESLWQSSKESDEYLPALHASFRLFACVRDLATGESNDDLEDAWAESQKGLAEVLIGLLSAFDPSFYPDMPWSITIDLLDWQIRQINVDHVQDVTGLFATLSIQSKGVQRAVYDVLHRIIPKSQEALSFDVALSDAVANLPDELISLLLDAPSASILSDYSIQDDIWMSIRCYLLSWKTVFDHFAFSSLPVQESYSANIKKNNCLNPLLDFTFDFLQLAQGKLVDASKFNVRSFELDESESPEKEIQWLLTHIYYLCLRYLPNLTKNWWLYSQNRVKGPVEAWTQKYISPVVIEDSLRSVMEWHSAQDWTNEEQALQVRVSYKAAEIVASIEIDEESPTTSISISLPPTYPLLQALVVGGSRVAVDDKKWKSWLLAIQGVIMFSNGNLVDALLAFRKNVQGALKGQGECAICYSVISTNMETPNKKCATCKNTFHSDCLFRWFRSSNSSSCPLCRNNFLYS
ncbi:C3HC4 type (RING finger) zinc finger containing protein [Coccidioides posadasii C735 delta SOWgp]|uniref:E3 ubiquitin-protein ligase listerin n=1 Tax=Coccidioides posadasii (strain C735) TaxID=222929 RepID=C5PA99_COCP7|nr:C3HC4 type (RING finger) zinc finger containing protein [Coccidioides posadasii C735 delta SOWgp]EER26661.1 C3HC4 type (RING finger) zinc finger containing protein [Coccidioides posadasii C735 delta SOWgp]|eukprot:XP_003068806.1 C3HC4 type (RING finger) zinc finger containing protein [Coccidioides posadasii C735 delta SOWgp]